MALCYFEGLACPDMPDQTQQILHEASMDIKLHAKKNIIPQLVFEKLKFKKFCNLICGEHFGL